MHSGLISIRLSRLDFRFAVIDRWGGVVGETWSLGALAGFEMASYSRAEVRTIGSQSYGRDGALAVYCTGSPAASKMDGMGGSSAHFEALRRDRIKISRTVGD